jgi:hypothetical protein
MGNADKATGSTKTTGKTPTIQIKLTDEQKNELIKFIKATGEANLDVGVVFDADVARGVVSPATFMVGAAV